MLTLLIAAASFVLYLVAYHTYGRWLGRRIFALDRQAAVPSQTLRDDRDYVPSPRGVVFGHHFTSIAGTGPIVGPALAIMWGWLPALLWVLIGSIFIGAVHDFGALVVSLRNRGHSVGDIAGQVLNQRVRLLFLSILLFALWVVLAIFGLVIASVFREFPQTVLPVFLQIPIAVGIGLYLHRRGHGLLGPSLLAWLAMLLTVWLGAGCPGTEWSGGILGESIRTANSYLAQWPIWVWTAVLLGYCYIASVLPVWVLLQPRDYINSLQLLSILLLLMVALVVGGTMGVGGQPVAMVAPMVQWQPFNAPPIWPVLFITIACGACSGFHCLVSSGTSSKQLGCETDAQLVGYGSMLTEGFLAVIVILSVGAGLGLGWPARFEGLLGSELWHTVYADWKAAGGLQTTLGAFVVGAANLLSAVGVDPALGTAIMGVMVASFAGTTLDTATRLQRYVVQELSGAIVERVPVAKPLVQPFGNAHVATFFAVGSAFTLAIWPAPGKPWSLESAGAGGQLLWPLFGATNQLLAGLAFLVIAAWLWRHDRPIWFLVPPAIFMLVMPAWALLVQVFGTGGWWSEGNYLLTFIGLGALVLQAWVLAEARHLWPKIRGLGELAEVPQ
jgi:carbon starvation protein